MACSNEILGDEFILLWNDGGDFNVPTWKEQISIGDVGLDFANEQVEIPMRTRYKHFKTGRGDWTLSFTANWNSAAGEGATPTSFFNTLQKMIDEGGNMHLGLTDQPLDAGNVVGSLYEAWFVVTGSSTGALDSPGQIEVEAKISFYRGDNCDELPKYTPKPAVAP